MWWGRKIDLIPWATLLKGTMEFPVALPQTQKWQRREKWENVAAASLSKVFLQKKKVLIVLKKSLIPSFCLICLTEMNSWAQGGVFGMSFCGWFSSRIFQDFRNVPRQKQSYKWHKLDLSEQEKQFPRNSPVPTAKGWSRGEKRSSSASESDFLTLW